MFWQTRQRILRRALCIFSSFPPTLKFLSADAASIPVYEPCPEVACGGSDAASVLGSGAPHLRAWRGAGAPPRDSQKNSFNYPGSADADAAGAGAASARSRLDGIACPPDRETLGRHTWTLVS